jgi:hypothetical protein
VISLPKAPSRVRSELRLGLGVGWGVPTGSEGAGYPSVAATNVAFVRATLENAKRFMEDAVIDRLVESGSLRVRRESSGHTAGQ